MPFLKTWTIAWGIAGATLLNGFAYTIVGEPGRRLQRPVWVGIDSRSIYMAGWIHNDQGVSSRIEKRNQHDGRLDEHFGQNGILALDPTDGDDYIVDGDLNNGWLYLLGLGLSASGKTQWRLEKRSAANGALDEHFGHQGVFLSEWGQNADAAHSLLVNHESIYISIRARSSHIPDEWWRIKKRDKLKGSLIRSFGVDGAIEINPSAESEEFPTVLALSSTSLFIGGHARGAKPNDFLWRIEKRDKNQGVLDENFGQEGILHVNPSPLADSLDVLVLDAEAFYLGGFEGSSAGDRWWRIEKRDQKTGALIQKFHDNGTLTGRPEWPNSRIFCVNIDQTNLSIAGYFNDGHERRWLFKKFNKENGRPLTAFKAFDGNDDLVYGQIDFVAMDRSYYYIAGWEKIPHGQQWRLERRDQKTGKLSVATPLPVTNLQFPRIYSTLATLEFTEPESRQDGYRIFRSSDGNHFNVFVSSVTATKKKNQIINFSDLGVRPGTTYWYQVRPYITSGEGIVLGPPETAAVYIKPQN